MLKSNRPDGESLRASFTWHAAACQEDVKRDSAVHTAIWSSFMAENRGSSLGAMCVCAFEDDIKTELTCV